MLEQITADSFFSGLGTQIIMLILGVLGIGGIGYLRKKHITQKQKGAGNVRQSQQIILSENAENSLKITQSQTGREQADQKQRVEIR